MMKLMCQLMALLALTCPGLAQEPKPQTDALEVPPEKQTELGLYVTAQQAYARWKASPEQVQVLDVRTPEEYAFVGHAAMARNIPFVFFQHQWDAERKRPVMTPNPDFVELVKKHYQKDQVILVTCRSGGRSKKAVDALAQAGFTKVYNIIDGMEGDTVEEPGSVYQGKRMKNGWKNSGAPWTYELDPDLMFLSKK